MKKVKMLYPAILVLCICFSCLCMASGASAAGYREGNTIWGQLYEDYKNSGTGSGIYGFYNWDCQFGSDSYTFVVPYYKDSDMVQGAFAEYSNTDSDYYGTKSWKTNLVYPAGHNLQGSTSFNLPFWDYDYMASTGGDFKDYGSTKVDFIYYVPFFRDLSSDESYMAYYSYLATGVVTDPSFIDLPDGWNLDEDGRPVEGQGDTIFSETFKVSFARGDTLWGLFDGNVTDYDASSFEKTVKDGYDKKMCFYKESLLSCVGNNASCLYVYTEKSASNNELIVCNSDQGIDKDLFHDLSHSLISDDGVSSDFYDIGGVLYLPGSSSGGGSHGGGHGTEDLVTRSFYSKSNICEDYPVVVDGLFCLNDKSDYNFDLIRGFDILMNLSVIGSVAISLEEYMETTSVISHLETPDISRPVFSSKEAAAKWYQTSIVEDYHNDIVYKPSGYYYHKSTKILDTNPGDDTSNDDEKDNNPFESSPGTDSTPVEPVNTVVSGSTVIVNVTQSNDNSYDSHDKVTASATATASAIVNNNLGDNGGDDGMVLPDADDDSLFDVIGDVVDEQDDDWFNLIKYAFGFLPKVVQDLLSGSVILRVIVGLFRRR